MSSNKKLSLEEKLRLLTGKNLWQTEDFNGKLRSIFFADGPHGLRKMKRNEYGNYENIPSIAYPNLVNIANTWNVAHAREVGELIAEDCVENEVDVLLAPGVNIKRTPLCGRNFEYFSEDPYLSGVMARAYIKGVQSRGIGACIKHFCVNNREVARYCQSSEVSERALHEIYLTAFKIALEAKPLALMSSYNPINGVYASENKYLLTDILRGELKYRGLVVSDWMGVKNGYKALKAGTTLRMPACDSAYDELKSAYDKGLISEADVDAAVSQILETLRKIESLYDKRKVTCSREQRRSRSLKIAEESIVLLKNESVLPLDGKKSVCVISDLNNRPYIGGGGAAEVLPACTQRPLSAYLGDNLQIPISISHRVRLDGLDPSHNDREGALLASENDVAIVLVGNSSTVEIEGKDRETLRLSSKEERLIKSVSATGVKTVVVIEAGSAIDVSPWIDDVDAVLFAGYLGDNANQAIANILSGKACPSGKLSETFPLDLEHTYCKDDTGNGNVEVYDDGVLVGYRYYDTKKVPVRYPFGFGLSYASFVYSNLQMQKLDNAKFEISFTITNTSTTDGMETCQVYVKDVVSTVIKPEKELKAFEKIAIKAGESQTVTLCLDESAFSHYDVVDKCDYVENGVFTVMIGASSRDIRLQGNVTVTLPDETQHSVM